MNNLIEKRFSPREYDKDFLISENDALELLRAAAAAPSSMNEQPWKFYYALKQNKEGFEKLYNLIVDGNKPWSGHASILILGVANTKFTRNGKLNRHAFYDLGQAVYSMALQAEEMGLNAHQMGGFNVEMARTELHLTEGLEPVVMISIGKFSGNSKPMRNRKALSEISEVLK